MLQSCAWLCGFLEAERDISRAKYFNEKLIKICLLIAEENKTVEICYNLAVAYYKAASYDADKKSVYLKKAIEIYEMLVNHCPNIALFRENLDMMRKSYNEACSK